MIPIPFRDPGGVRATLRTAALAFVLVAAGGCATADEYLPTWRSFGVYKMDVNQGNYLSQDMVDKLKVGMTQAQVRQVLGTPLVASPFRADRWDYVYEYTRQGRVTEHRTFTVWFADSKLARWEGDALPETVLDLNRSASAKALPSNAPGEKSAWDRLLDVFRN
ncbi:MAG TPA: outer membrane protein assembly factor BamE [Casimicrobiaceae bacterium]|nr:outer membrane protein assembly factor BamE [Casimicrobiaceae bacterium]